MGHDLTKATLAAAGGGYDLRRAAQMTPGGPIAFTKARQASGTRGGLDLGRANAAPGTDTGAIPKRAKKKAGR